MGVPRVKKRPIRIKQTPRGKPHLPSEITTRKEPRAWERMWIYETVSRAHPQVWSRGDFSLALFCTITLSLLSNKMVPLCQERIQALSLPTYNILTLDGFFKSFDKQLIAQVSLLQSTNYTEGYRYKEGKCFLFTKSYMDLLANQVLALTKTAFPWPFIYPYTLCYCATHLREIIAYPGTSTLSKTQVKVHSTGKSSFHQSHSSYCFVHFYIHFLCFGLGLILHWFDNINSFTICRQSCLRTLHCFLVGRRLQFFSALPRIPEYSLCTVDINLHVQSMAKD